jgi:nucleoside-diphosphate kinase
MYEKSLIIIKPDGIQRRFAGRILQRFEDVGLRIHAIKLVKPTQDLSRQHYEEHVNKPFYPPLEEYITSAPVLVMVLGGLKSIQKVRTMIGSTVPAAAAPGTIRGDFAHQCIVDTANQSKALQNLVHASANAEDAAREIKIWFSDDDVLEYDMVDDSILGA